MQKWNFKWHLKAGLMAALLAISTAAQAQPMASVKAMGMGGTSVAYGQDSLTAFYNPATAGEVETRYDLEFDGRWTEKKLQLSDRPAGFQSGHFNNTDRWNYYGAAGFNYRFGCCNEWAFGTQWNNYDQIRTRYRQPLLDFSGENLDGSAAGRNLQFNYRAEALTFTGAYSLDECHTFGIGLNVYFSWLNLQGLNIFADPDFTNSANNFTDRGDDEASGVGVTLGYLGRFFCDQLAVGLAWSPKVHMGQFRKYKGFLADHRIDIPETFRLGVAYDLDCCTTFAADYEFRRYSGVHSLSNNFLGDRDLFDPRFGEHGGPGFGWNDQSVLKLGLDYQYSDCMNVRLGYRWEQSPQRRQSSDTYLNLLTQQVIENHLTFGFTYDWDCCSELSYFADWGIVDHKKAFSPEIASNFDTASGKEHFESQSFATGIAWGQRF